MQDRFKFRFWNTKIKCMYEDTGLTSLGVNGSIKSALKNNYVIMQSTGLKDKHGKLIYEGDIVNVYVSSEKLYRYQVKFEIGSFMLVSNEEIFDFPNKWNDNVYPLSQLYFEYENEDYCIEQLEVIDNIYENPELLEVEND